MEFVEKGKGRYPEERRFHRILLAFFLSIFFCIESFSLDCVVYVINLDRSPERMKKMKKQLNKLGIKFIRFKAIDGDDITIANTKSGKIEDNKSFHKNCDKDATYSIHCEQFDFKYNSGGRRALCYGEFGCALSHLSVIKDIMKNNYKRAIIFEDDVSLEDNFKSVAMATLKNAPADTDVLFLDVGVWYDRSSPYFVSPGQLLASFRRLSPDNKYVVRLNESASVFGTHAYAVTLNGAKKILEDSKYLEYPIDNHIMMNKRLSKYVARKKTLYIADDPSVIHQMGRNFSVVRDGILVDGRK